MANSMPYMLWYSGDFMRSTRGWSVTAKGVYRELLDAQWDHGEVPADPEELRVVIGATKQEWRDGWRRCAAKFPEVEPGIRRNARLEEHRAVALASRERRANAGRVGGQASAQARVKQPSTLASAIVKLPAPAPAPDSESRVGGESAQPKTATRRAPAVRGTRIPDDFELTAERRAYASKQRIDPDRAFANFVDYWTTKAGPGAVKLGWDRVWQRWCREDAERAAAKRGGLPAKPPADPAAIAAAEAAHSRRVQAFAEAGPRHVAAQADREGKQAVDAVVTSLAGRMRVATP